MNQKWISEPTYIPKKREFDMAVGEQIHKFSHFQAIDSEVMTGLHNINK